MAMYADSVGGIKAIVTFIIGILVQVLSYFKLVTPDMADSITKILMFLAAIFWKDSWNKANLK